MERRFLAGEANRLQTARELKLVHLEQATATVGGMEAAMAARRLQGVARGGTAAAVTGTRGAVRAVGRSP